VLLPAAFFAITVKLYVLGVGVTSSIIVATGTVIFPDIAPVLALRLKPGGRAPLVIDQVIGVEPVAVSFWLYVLLTEPIGNETVVISGIVKTLIFNDFELFPAEFSALTVNVDVTAVVGVPEITPVLVLRLKPTGRVPLVIDNVICTVPLAVSV
jgi:hypothetical protein